VFFIVFGPSWVPCLCQGTAFIHLFPIGVACEPIGVKCIKKTHGIDVCVFAFFAFFLLFVICLCDTFGQVVGHFLAMANCIFRPIKTLKKPTKIDIWGLACSLSFMSLSDFATLILQLLHRL
jgi:hypothetical protein